MKNRSAPPTTVTPILVYEDVGQAIEFRCRAFGFSERLRAEYGGHTKRDHAGHWWTFSQHVADVAPEEWGAKLAGPA